jgi:hypothetical protein
MTKTTKKSVKINDLWQEGECQGCDQWCSVNDLGLCEECDAKLDRDLIRQRDWEYSMTAAVTPPEQREELRQKVIAQYGAKNELISLPEKKHRAVKSRSERKRN